MMVGRSCVTTCSAGRRNVCEGVSPNNRAVGDREAAKFQKAVISQDARDARPFDIGIQKRVTYAMHSPQGEIADRSCAQMFLAGGA